MCASVMLLGHYVVAKDRCKLVSFDINIIPVPKNVILGE
jgi:hypothetical protein